MLKKGVSCLITAGIISQLFPSVTMALGGLSLKSFNATGSAVIVNFDGVSENSFIDADTLKDNIVLEKHEKDGTISVISDMEFTVTEDMHGLSKNANNTNTVVITPYEGISDKAFYRLTLKKGISDTKNVMLDSEESTGWFGVEILFTDDFEGTFDEDSNPVYPYSYGYRPNQTKPYVASAYWSASYREEFTTVSNSKNVSTELNCFQLRNNNQHAILTEEGLGERYSDYSVEATLGLPKAYNNNVGISIRNSSSSAANGYSLVFQKGDYNAQTAQLSFSVNNKAVYTSDTYKLRSNTPNIRLCAEGDNVMMFADNDKLFDVTDSQISSAGGTAVYGGTVYNQLPNITFDNVVLSRIIRYGNNMPQLKINSSLTDIDNVFFEFNNFPDKDGIDNYITLRKNGEKVQVFAECDGKTVTVRPENKFDDGDYLLTVKNGAYAKNSAILENPYQIKFFVENGDIYEMPIDKPEITDLNVDIKNNEFTLIFKYVGENENNSKYIVYTSDTPNGSFEETDSGVLAGEETIVKTVGDEFTGKYIKLRIEPEDSKG